MTLLASLADTYGNVSSTSSRTAKLKSLARQISVLDHEEVEIGVDFLAGRTRQGKIGVGYSLLGDLTQVETADEAELSLTEVDQTLAAVAAIRGPGGYHGDRPQTVSGADGAWVCLIFEWQLVSEVPSIRAGAG